MNRFPKVDSLPGVHVASDPACGWWYLSYRTLIHCFDRFQGFKQDVVKHGFKKG